MCAELMYVFRFNGFKVFELWGGIVEGLLVYVGIMSGKFISKLTNSKLLSSIFMSALITALVDAGNS